MSKLFCCKRISFSLLRKAINVVVVLCFSLFTVVGPAGSQTFGVLGTGLTSGLAADGLGTSSHIACSVAFQPPVLRGMTVHPENPLLFDFIVDRGQDKIGNDLLKDESTKLIKYFLTSMTIPDKDAWVNLSPTEKDRIIPDALGQTEMGRAMLEQDYVLKQLAASLTNPETDLGKKYWDEVNRLETLEKTTNVQRPATNNFNKVWIVPDGATVVEKDGFAYITESKLKVMLDEDRSLDGQRSVEIDTGAPPTVQKNLTPPNPLFKKEGGSISTQVFREMILPKLIEEVNSGKNFAATRQVYQSVILAAWYKRALKDSLLGRIYADKSKIAGVETDVKDIKQKVYEQYLEAFKKGAYSVIKEEVGPDGDLIPRKYFSGGQIMASAPIVVSSPAAVNGVRQEINQSERVGRIALVATNTVENLQEATAKESNKISSSSIAQKLVAALVALTLSLTPSANVSAQEQEDIRSAVEKVYAPDLSENRVMILADLEMLNFPTASLEFKASVRNHLEDLFKKEGYGLIPFYKKFDPAKPVVLFIHGASGEGGAAKFIDALALHHQGANSLGYQFDVSKPLPKIAEELADKWQRFKKENNVNNSNVIFVAHSYGAVVLRAVFDKASKLSKGTALVEIAPTYGGSRYAFRYGDGKIAEIATDLLGYKAISEAQNPNGMIQNWLFRPEAIEKLGFRSMSAYMVEGDPNNPKQKSEMSAEELNFFGNFQNGLKGANEVIYLNGTDVTHGNAPSAPEVLEALGKLIKAASSASSSVDDLSSLNIVYRGDGYGIYEEKGGKGVLLFIGDKFDSYDRLENVLRLLALENFGFGKVESGTIKKPFNFRMGLGQIARDIKGFLKKGYESGKKSILNYIEAEFDTTREIPSMFEVLTGLSKSGDFERPILEYSRREPILTLQNIKGAAVSIKDTLLGLNRTLPYIKFETLPGGQVISKSSLWKQSSFDETLDVLIDLAGTFQKMHEAGIIYNNVNAQSVMVGQKDGKTVAMPYDFSQSYLYGYEARNGQRAQTAMRSDIIELARMISIEIKAQVPFYEHALDGPIEELIHMTTDIYYAQKNIPKDMAEFADWLLEIKEDSARARTEYAKLEKRLFRQRGSGAASSSVGDVKVSSTPAVSNDSTVGGIDFDPSKLNLQIKRDGRGVPLPLPQQDLENINIKGLYPVILNILPVNSQTLPILGQLSEQADFAVLKG